MALSGTASDNVAVDHVTWSNAATGASGTATGTTSWSVTGIVLNPGINVITATAFDAAGNSSSATLTVTLDQTPPTISITSPTSQPTLIVPNTNVTLGGTAADNVALSQVFWSIPAINQNGACNGLSNWTTVNLSTFLVVGSQFVVVTAVDTAGNTGNATVTIVVDQTPPTVQITAPTSNPTLSVTQTSTAFRLGGTAADAVGLASVSWSSDKTGSGTCTGTTSWSTNGLTLAQGVNVITVTATDLAGNTATARITITFTLGSPIPMGGFGSMKPIILRYR